ncbi:GTPase Era [compost metagenome]
MVARDGQKAIVVGKGGARIKEIGRLARLEMQKSFDRPVHLFLHVKVREKWAEDRARYGDWGLDYDAK